MLSQENAFMAFLQEALLMVSSVQTTEHLQRAIGCMLRANRDMPALVASLNAANRVQECAQAGRLYEQLVAAFKAHLATPADTQSGAYLEQFVMGLAQLAATFVDVVSQVWCWKTAARALIANIGLLTDIQVVAFVDAAHRSTATSGHLAGALSKVVQAVNQRLEASAQPRKDQAARVLFSLDAASSLACFEPLLRALAGSLCYARHKTFRLGLAALRLALAVMPAQAAGRLLETEDDGRLLVLLGAFPFSRLPAKPRVLSEVHFEALPPWVQRNLSRELVWTSGSPSNPFAKLRRAACANIVASFAFAQRTWLHRHYFFDALVFYGRYGTDVSIFGDPRLASLEQETMAYFQNTSSKRVDIRVTDAMRARLVDAEIDVHRDSLRQLDRQIADLMAVVPHRVQPILLRYQRQ